MPYSKRDKRAVCGVRGVCVDCAYDFHADLRKICAGKWKKNATYIF